VLLDAHRAKQAPRGMAVNMTRFDAKSGALFLHHHPASVVGGD
jgi:hypothetical protein